MNARLRFTAPLFVVVASLSSVGCARDEEEDATTATVTSALQASEHGSLTRDIVDVDGESAIAPAKAADFIATKRPIGIQPEGCMTKTRNGDGVHIVFRGCTGPFGKVVLTGSADVTFSLDAQQRLVAEIVGGPDLRANDRELRYRAHGTVEVAGDVRNLTWHAEASGETKRGRKYSRSTDLSLSVDTAKRCIEASGVAKGTIAGFDLEVTVDDFAVCENACPTRGKAEGLLRGPRGKERSIEVTFDGSDRAHVKASNGKERDVRLACAEAEAAED